MCGRYALFKRLEEIDQFLNAIDSGAYRAERGRNAFLSNYNAAPTQEMPVAFVNEEGYRVVDLFHWGFMGWKPNPGNKPFFPVNTRSESIHQKPMWAQALRNRRCIVPANGFYEWVGSGSSKKPFYIYPNKDQMIGFAGIYSDLAPENKNADRSFSIITTTANKLMQEIHERMPVILHPDEFDSWLNPDTSDPAILKEFLKPYPDDALSLHIVSSAVGNVRNNDEYLINKATLF